ncbi:MAG TPA: hypothetical protein PLD25_25700 [Chloroflexota bacterium]|nr:hypothetical protein [Chloroflexota bacterium]
MQDWVNRQDWPNPYAISSSGDILSGSVVWLSLAHGLKDAAITFIIVVYSGKPCLLQGSKQTDK